MSRRKILIARLSGLLIWRMKSLLCKEIIKEYGDEIVRTLRNFGDVIVDTSKLVENYGVLRKKTRRMMRKSKRRRKI